MNYAAAGSAPAHEEKPIPNRRGLNADATPPNIHSLRIIIITTKVRCVSHLNCLRSTVMSDDTVNTDPQPGAALQARRARVRKICEFCGGEYIGLRISKYCSKQHQKLAINARQYEKVAAPETAATSCRVYRKRPLVVSTVLDGDPSPTKQPLKPHQKTS